MTAIHFNTILTEINEWTILKIPIEESKKLPSRSQVMVKGKIDDYTFVSPVEPDGNGSHWLHIDDKMRKAIIKSAGDSVDLSIEALKDWPEPEIPADIQKGIVDNPETHDLWTNVTPMSRWEWLRWISSTTNPETRKKRIEVSRSKLVNGLRRPCCFNRSMCCVPQVSKSGVLIGVI